MTYDSRARFAPQPKDLIRKQLKLSARGIPERADRQRLGHLARPPRFPSSWAAVFAHTAKHPPEFGNSQANVVRALAVRYTTS